MSKLTRTDIAYAAAVIDNLAALRSRFHGPAQLPVVQISGKLPVLHHLAEITGTKVIETSRSYTRHQCTEHCPDRHTHLASRSLRWSITGMRATIVLLACEPHMLIQGATARRLVETGLGVRYHGSVVNDMATRGWPIPELEPHPRARVPLKAVN